MKVVCINDTDYFFVLTNGNCYNVIEKYNGLYKIKCDLGYELYTDSIVFVSIKEYRKQKLEKINDN